MATLGNFLTKNEYKSFDTTFDNARITIAIVKDTRSFSRTGELRVWIPTSRIPEEDSSRWVIARYASPFYGVSTNNQTYNQTYNEQQKSYGFFFVPPDVGNKVFIFYPNIQGGDTMAYWFACPVDPYLSSMIPGIAYSSDTMQPTIEKTVGVKKNTQDAEDINNSNIPYEPLVSAIQKQGLEQDLLRGYSSSSMKRESPSRSYGILTPYGHQFVIDDGWSESDTLNNWDDTDEKQPNNSISNDIDIVRYDSGIRLRTRDGVQILLSNTKGHIYMINKDGTAWVELNNDGYIDCWSLKGISASTEGDINFNAKRNININAGGNINIKSVGDIKMESNNMTMKMKENILSIAGVNIEQSANQCIINKGDTSIQYQTPITIIDSEDISLGGNVKVKEKIDTPLLNSTTVKSGNVFGNFNGDVNGMCVFATTAGSAPDGSASPYTNPQTPPSIESTDTSDLPQDISDVKMNTIHTGLNNIIDSINSRQPSLEPFYYHFYNDNNEDQQIPVVQETKKVLASGEKVETPITIVNKKGETMADKLPPDLRPDEEIIKLNKDDLSSVFEKSFQELMVAEGGYVNDPDDPGGETKYGVSKRAYPHLDIYNLTLDDARAIFKKDYWDACRCDDLPDALSIMVADFAYNSGVSRAVKYLYLTVGMSESSKVSNELITKIKSMDINVILDEYKRRRLSFLQGLKTWSKYGKGWSRRVANNYNLATAYV